MQEKLLIKDIADQLGVSKTVVSWVLNGKAEERNISAATQEKVLKYAEEHHYQPNFIAKSLSLGKTNTIGLIVPNIADTFYVQVARTIEIEAEKRGYSMIYSSSEGSGQKEALLIRLMTSGKVDGLIVAPTRRSRKEFDNMVSNNFPFVLIDRYFPELNSNYVIQNNRQGIFDLASYMMLKRRERIAIITTEMHLLAMQARVEGFRQVYEQSGKAFDEEWIKVIDYDNLFHDLFSALRSLVFPQLQVDSILFATHYLAIEGIRILQEFGMEMPDKIAVTSYGDDNCFTMVSPKVTAMRLPFKEMGRRAVDILVPQMADRDLERKGVVIDATLVVRESC